MKYIKLLVMGITRNMSVSELKHVLNKFKFKPNNIELVPNTSSTQNQPTYALYLEHKHVGLRHKFPSANSFGVSETSMYYDRPAVLADYVDMAINITPSKSIETLKALTFRGRTIYDYKSGEDLIVHKKTDKKVDLYIDLSKTVSYSCYETQSMTTALGFISSSSGPVRSIIKIVKEKYEKGGVVQLVPRDREDYLGKAIKSLIISSGAFTSRTKKEMHFGKEI